MGKVHVRIEEADSIALNRSADDVSKFLKKYLLDKPGGTFRQICENLQDYYKDEGGSPLVLEFAIDDAACSFDTASGRGKVKLKYAVQYHFGCSDLSPSTDIAETCDFSLENTILTVFIPDKVVRDTIDEF